MFNRITFPVKLLSETFLDSLDVGGPSPRPAPGARRLTPTVPAVPATVRRAPTRRAKIAPLGTAVVLATVAKVRPVPATGVYRVPGVLLAATGRPGGRKVARVAQTVPPSPAGAEVVGQGARKEDPVAPRPTDEVVPHAGVAGAVPTVHVTPQAKTVGVAGVRVPVAGAAARPANGPATRPDQANTTLGTQDVVATSVGLGLQTVLGPAGDGRRQDAAPLDRGRATHDSPAAVVPRPATQTALVAAVHATSDETRPASPGETVASETLGLLARPPNAGRVLVTTGVRAGPVHGVANATDQGALVGRA